MKVIVQRMASQDSMTFEVDPQSTLASLRQMIHASEPAFDGISIALLLGDRLLGRDDDKTSLKCLGLRDESTLLLVTIGHDALLEALRGMDARYHEFFIEYGIMSIQDVDALELKEMARLEELLHGLDGKAWDEPPATSNPCACGNATFSRFNFYGHPRDRNASITTYKWCTACFNYGHMRKPPRMRR